MQEGQQFLDLESPSDSQPVLLKNVETHPPVGTSLIPDRDTRYVYDAGTTDDQGRNVGASLSVKGPRMYAHQTAAGWDPGALFSYEPATVMGLFSSKSSTHVVPALLGTAHAENEREGNGRLAAPRSLSKHSSKLVNNLIDAGYFGKDTPRAEKDNHYDFEDVFTDMDCEDAECEIDEDNEGNDYHNCGEDEVTGANSLVSDSIDMTRLPGIAGKYREQPDWVMEEGSQVTRQFLRQARPNRKPAVTGPRHSKGNNPDQMTIDDINASAPVPRHKRP